MKYNIKKLQDVAKSFLRQIFTETQAYLKKINKKSQINNLTSYLKHQEIEEQVQCKTNKEKVDNKHQRGNKQRHQKKLMKLRAGSLKRN